MTFSASWNWSSFLSPSITNQLQAGVLDAVHVRETSRSKSPGAGVRVSSGDGHTLEINVSGSHFKVLFDAKPLFEADDQTFEKAGKVGLWTKADSVACFDDLLVVKAR